MENKTQIILSLPVQMLITVSNTKENLSYVCLCKKLNYTYHHMLGVLKQFEKAGFITTEKKGRSKIIKITEKGKIIADNLKKITERVEQ